LERRGRSKRRLRPPLDWTGFYIGGTVGGDWTDNNSVNVVTTDSFINFLADSPLGISSGAASATASSGTVGVGRTGGFEGGYNYQFQSNVVVGFETDIENLSGGGSGALTQVISRAGFQGFNYTSTVAVSDHLHYLGTVRGRLGFLPKSTLLPYFTGGLAYGGASSSTAITGGETPFTDSSNIAGVGTFSGTRIGWTIGGGVEWMLSRNWTVKAEYLHYDLGTATYSNGTMTAFLTPLPGLPPSAMCLPAVSSSAAISFAPA
jgi:outer membrane immunogenic protein